MTASPERSRDHRIADEQAALRRVAVLVARAAPPGEVFAAVTEEAGRLLGAGHAAMSRYDPDGAVRVVAAWSSTGAAVPVGTRVGVGGRNVHTLVFQTGRPARINDYRDTSGPAADVANDWGFRSAVGAPISVEGRLWGVISVATTSEEPLPADSEARLAGFAELVGTALSNAEAQAALTASRARIVAAGDTARRRIERDLHDGAQQRLVSLALEVRAVRAAVPPAAGELAAQLDSVADGLTAALEELRQVALGLHPTVLGRTGPGAQDADPPLRRPRPPRRAGGRAAARTDRARRLLRRGRGADQRRQARLRHRHRRRGGRRRRRLTCLRSGRRARRRRRHPRLRPRRPRGPGRDARRPHLAAQPTRRRHQAGHRTAP